MFVANVSLWIGLVLIIFINSRTLVEFGPEPVMMYNPDSYVLCMGAVVVCFEGIGLVLPLRDSLDPFLQARQSLCRCFFAVCSRIFVDSILWTFC